MPTETFFEDKQTPESAAKVDIVTTFFSSWLAIIGRSKWTGPLAYIDLFAGPGIYSDGTRSTPVIVLEQILNSPHANRFKVIYNERDQKLAGRLKENVLALPVDRLGFAPVLLTEEVTSQNAAEFLVQLPNCPAVMFVDPWGYRGLSLSLFLKYLTGSWGRDAIFFFNFKRINAAISQPDFAPNMDALFGRDRAQALRFELNSMKPIARRLRVYEAMEEALKEAGVNFVMRYDFEERHDSLYFLTQADKGLRTMKHVMAKRSTKDEHGLPTFSYVRQDVVEAQRQQGVLGFMAQPSRLDDLSSALLTQFAGRSVTFDELFREHHPSTNLLESHYRSVLESLFEEGKIDVACSGSRRRRGTFGPKVVISFPQKNKS